MWPWAHLAVGYLLYSLYCRARGRVPTGYPVLALAVGTQFPDLVDKPLAWRFGVLPSGLSLAHSLLFALPFVAVVGLVALRYGSTSVATGFAVGYLSHLPADVVYPLLLDRNVDPRFLLWPLYPAVDPERVGLFANVTMYFSRYVELLLTPLGLLFALAEVGLVLSAVALWVRDGAPGLRELWSAVMPSPSTE